LCHGAAISSRRTVGARHTNMLWDWQRGYTFLKTKIASGLEKNHLLSLIIMRCQSAFQA